MCADWRAGSAHTSNQQADSTWASTLDYLEDESSRQAETVPPLPEPMQVAARQVLTALLKASGCHTCVITAQTASTPDHMMACDPCIAM